MLEWTVLRFCHVFQQCTSKSLSPCIKPPVPVYPIAVTLNSLVCRFVDRTEDVKGRFENNTSRLPALGRPKHGRCSKNGFPRNHNAWRCQKRSLRHYLPGMLLFPLWSFKFVSTFYFVCTCHDLPLPCSRLRN